MKKATILILAISLTLFSMFYISSCSKKDEKNIDANASDKITQYINEHPYFNPYNTIVDCDNDYCYCVINRVEPEKNYGLSGGIYRNAFNDPDLNHTWNPLYQNQTDDIFSLSIDNAYIFFLKRSEKSKLFRVDKATGKNPKEIDIELSENETAKSVRCVNGLIFIDLTDKYLILTPNGENYSSCYDYTEENDVYNRRTPWSELLPDDWSVTTATKDKSEGTISVKHGDKEYLISSNSNFLIDYPEKTIYCTYNEENSTKIVSMDMGGNTLKEFNINKNVRFKNVSLGTLCGFTDERNLYLFKTSDESEQLLDMSDIDYDLYNFIDIVDNTMSAYLMNTDDRSVTWLYGFANTKAEIIGK